MPNFSEKNYQQVLALAKKYNFMAHCREYPFFSIAPKKIAWSLVEKHFKKVLLDKKKSFGVYAHFPFCHKRCLFCKYFSEINPKPTIFDKYLNFLVKEIRLYSDFYWSNRSLNNLYFGGGTPTIMSSGQIKKLAEIFNNNFNFDKKTQVSVEGTPETLTMDKLKAWRELGVNRISIGCQTFNDNILRKIGRGHLVSDIFKTGNLIRVSGINIFSVDILFGLPGETKYSYKKTLKSLIKLSPDFIEAFLLSPGGRAKIKKQQPRDTSLDWAIKNFEQGLQENGYRLYFKGNFMGFVKKGIRPKGAMNQNTEQTYNQTGFCLGLGPSAISQFGGLKYRTISNNQDYFSRLKKNLPPKFIGVQLSHEQQKRQYIISRIGYYRFIEKGDYKNIFGTELKTDFPEKINMAKQEGLVIEAKKRFRWNFKEKELGHEEFFLHVLKLWYEATEITKILKKILNSKLL